MENLTRRSVLIGLSSAAVAETLTPQLFAANTEHLAFIGVYTDKGSKSKGIYAYKWDAEKGELSPLGLAAATRNPSFLAISRDRTHLYAANEISDYDGAKDGAVSAFSVVTSTGKLTPLNALRAGGAGPCNLNLDATGKCLAVANYNGGTATTYVVGADGRIGSQASTASFEGHGPYAQRQEASHAHCATFTPDNQHLLINDLGLDCIHIYEFDPQTAKLGAKVPPAYKAIAGSGPRSLVFHPNGRIVYESQAWSSCSSAPTLNTTQLHAQDRR